MQDFQFIPVLDLKDGTTVYAERGNRASYQPIETPLAIGSDPVAIAGALLDNTGENSLYIADVDAIMRHGSNRAAVKKIAEAFPETSLWLDPGVTDIDDCRDWLKHDRLQLVIATETSNTPDSLSALTTAELKRVILSLDFGPEGFRGDEAFLNTPELWPEKIIVMSLSQVGSGGGPDTSLLSNILAKAGDRHVFAAGGLRNIEDAERLEQLGASGILLASAIHAGHIGQNEIAAFRKRRRLNF